VLRLWGGVVVDIELDRFARDDLVNLRGEAAPIPGVGVELVTSLKGDFSSLRDELSRSISRNAAERALYDELLDTQC
jgi:hypothetical protein